MKEHRLAMRKQDKPFFEAIKKDLKKVETRAASPLYLKIKEGDILVFSCSGKKLKKKAKKIYYFKTIDKLLKRFAFKEIMPFASSKDEAIKIWHAFPKYKERLAKYGIIAFLLG